MNGRSPQRRGIDPDPRRASRETTTRCLGADELRRPAAESANDRRPHLWTVQYHPNQLVLSKSGPPRRRYPSRVVPLGSKHRYGSSKSGYQHRRRRTQPSALHGFVPDPSQVRTAVSTESAARRSTQHFECTATGDAIQRRPATGSTRSARSQQESAFRATRPQRRWRGSRESCYHTEARAVSPYWGNQSGFGRGSVTPQRSLGNCCPR